MGYEQKLAALISRLDCSRPELQTKFERELLIEQEAQAFQSGLDSSKEFDDWIVKIANASKETRNGVMDKVKIVGVNSVFARMRRVLGSRAGKTEEELIYDIAGCLGAAEDTLDLRRARAERIFSGLNKQQR